MADEQALVVAEIIENHIQTLLNSQSNEPSKEALLLDIFKVCFLELVYEQSSYNFDIQLLILKSFDRLGFSASFSEVYDTLGLKGVQLESLGYLLARNSIKWVQFTLQSQHNPKYQKYLRNNARDIADMKIEAVQKDNYSQLDNFIEYEQYLGNSYFGQFQLEYLEKGKNLLSNFLKPEVQPNTLEFFSQSYSHEDCQIKLQELLNVKMERT